MHDSAVSTRTKMKVQILYYGKCCKARPSEIKYSMPNKRNLDHYRPAPAAALR